MNVRFLSTLLFTCLFLAACNGLPAADDDAMPHDDSDKEHMMDDGHTDDDMIDGDHMDDDMDDAVSGTNTPGTSGNTNGATATSPFVSKNVWTANASQSSLTFFGSSPVSEHPGQFTDFDTTLTFDSAHPGDLLHATLEVSINIASVRTDSGGLDQHLQAEDYFDAAAFPTATFVSTRIEKSGAEAYMITGNLTIKGITRQAALRATVNNRTLNASYGVPREEFNVGTSLKAQAIDKVIPIETTIVFE